MRQLYLYVEGQTEQTFADTVLMPHLALFEVYLMGCILVEHSRAKGRTHRGGVTRYEPFKRGLLSILKQHDRPDVTISTMVDLYSLPNTFPGWEEAKKLRGDPQSRVASLEQSLAADINSNRERFIPYIQLHEYEALLFADPEKMSLYYAEQPNAISELQRIADAHENPELINDGESTAPSKRIIAHLPDYEGAKVVVGPQVAEIIGLDTLRAKCPHFSEWVKALEQLGRSP
jgi:hypothetical protein